MYKVEFSESAIKQLKKLDKQTSRIIKNWVINRCIPDEIPVWNLERGNMDREIVRELQQVIRKVSDAAKSTVSVNDKAELESILSDLFKVETRLSVYQKYTQNRKEEI